MPITVSCPGCGVSLELGDALLGRRAKCPDCNARFEVPMAPTVIAEEPSPAAEAPIEIPTLSLVEPTRAPSPTPKGKNLDSDWYKTELIESNEKAISAAKSPANIATMQQTRPDDGGTGKPTPKTKPKASQKSSPEPKKLGKAGMLALVAGLVLLIGGGTGWLYWKQKKTTDTEVASKSESEKNTPGGETTTAPVSTQGILDNQKGNEPAKELSADEIHQRLLHSTVLIKTYGMRSIHYGSGVLVDRDQRLI